MIVKQGNKGAPIGTVQQLLIESGLTIDSSEIMAAFFGPSTYAAMRAFQSNHLDRLGKPLEEDGVCGPETLWALVHQGSTIQDRFTAPGWRCSPSEARAVVRPVIEAALCDLALPTFEEPDGSNAGPRLVRYANGGAPWCAYAVSDWYSHAEGGSPFGVKASAYKLLEWAKVNGRVLGSGALPQPGDIAIILRGDLHGHVELVVGLSQDSADVHAIGANVSNSVRGTVRARGSITAFVRPIPLQ